ncbi:MAG TPA: hypothetical protein VGG03_08675 [Thermoanaerobaculia bacterium]|jgi:hypothetical protein
MKDKPKDPDKKEDKMKKHEPQNGVTGSTTTDPNPWPDPPPPPKG